MQAWESRSVVRRDENSSQRRLFSSIHVMNAERSSIRWAGHRSFCFSNTLTHKQRAREMIYFRFRVTGGEQQKEQMQKLPCCRERGRKRLKDLLPWLKKSDKWYNFWYTSFVVIRLRSWDRRRGCRPFFPLLFDGSLQGLIYWLKVYKHDPGNL